MKQNERAPYRFRHAWISVLILLCVSVTFSFTALASKSAGIQTIDDLAGKRIAIQTGTNHDELLEKKENLKDKLTLSYYNNPADAIEALKTGKVDAVPLDKPVAEIYCNKNPGLKILDEQMDLNNLGIGFQKDSIYVDAFNEALEQLKKDNVLQELEAKWTGADDSVKIPIAQDWDGVNGTLNYWVDTTYEPMSYMGADSKLLGYDVDVVLHAARIMGYRIAMTPCSFDGLIPALVSGKADIVSSGISITEERAESIDFSDTYYVSSVVMVVKDLSADSGVKKTGIWEAVSGSFERTFIKDNRWKLFARGIVNTLIITVLSALFGTVLGFLSYLICRTGGKGLTKVFEVFFSLLERMPIIVILMVFYYVILGNTDISGMLVSIIAFTLTFSASMYGMLKTGVNALSYGQTEAGYALGYNKRDTFFKILLPQAARIFMPSYRSEIIALIKGTAVVGYIAVQDLTKMGDIVRSRTYEAFFPLITTAAIYVILTWILTFIVSRVEISIDPKRRKKEQILKGVEIK